MVLPSFRIDMRWLTIAWKQLRSRRRCEGATRAMDATRGTVPEGQDPILSIGRSSPGSFPIDPGSKGGFEREDPGDRRGNRSRCDPGWKKKKGPPCGKTGREFFLSDGVVRTDGGSTRRMYASHAACSCGCGAVERTREFARVDSVEREMDGGEPPSRSTNVHDAVGSEPNARLDMRVREILRGSNCCGDKHVRRSGLDERTRRFSDGVGRRLVLRTRAVANLAMGSFFSGVEDGPVPDGTDRTFTWWIS